MLLLAGGAASRLPGKLELPVDGEPMLARVHRRLTAGGRPSIISAKQPLPPALARRIEAPLVYDVETDAGPLGGLAVAAAAVRTPLVFAAAGDLPNVDAAFIDRLEAEFDRLAACGEAPDAVLPVWPDDRAEPLAALYVAERLAAAATAALHAGERKVMAAVATMVVARLRLGAEDESVLANVNTQTDYDAQRRL